MNKINQQERAGTMHGVEGRFFGVVAASNGRILNQQFKATRYYEEEGRKYRITAEIRFDDECNNGHESFAVAADIRENGREYMGGCCHEEVARHFPELAPLIRWHLTSTDGPMHYIANTVYHAGNRDHWGKLKGEPRSWEQAVKFSDSPIAHKVGDKFAAFLKAKLAGDKVFYIVPIEHDGDSKPGGYKFGPKYTFDGYAGRWHECPFDSLAEAQEWQAALIGCRAEFITMPCAWGEGKARELDHARSCAVWPEATDAELCADDLADKLRARHPALMAEFKAAMIGAGLIWPEHQPEKVSA